MQSKIHNELAILNSVLVNLYKLERGLVQKISYNNVVLFPNDK